MPSRHFITCPSYASGALLRNLACAMLVMLSLLAGSPPATAQKEGEEAPASLAKLASLYWRYFDQRDINGLLKLYDQGADAGSLLALRRMYLNRFDQNQVIASIEFAEVSSGLLGKDGYYNYTARNTGAVMKTSLPPTGQMVVTVNLLGRVSLKKSDSRSQLPMLYTMVSKKNGKYYLLAFRQQNAPQKSKPKKPAEPAASKPVPAKPSTEKSPAPKPSAPASGDAPAFLKEFN